MQGLRSIHLPKLHIFWRAKQAFARSHRRGRHFIRDQKFIIGDIFNLFCTYASNLKESQLSRKFWSFFQNDLFFRCDIVNLIGNGRVPY